MKLREKTFTKDVENSLEEEELVEKGFNPLKYFK